MANVHLATTLASFEATVQRTKNRLIAVPAKVQRQLGLRRRANNHILLYSIRGQGRGRWNHHLAYLTDDNEFCVPSDVTKIEPGDRVEVKIHRVIPDADALTQSRTSTKAPAALLSELAELAQASEGDERIQGSQRVDEYLDGSVHG